MKAELLQIGWGRSPLPTPILGISIRCFQETLEFHGAPFSNQSK